MTNHKVCPFCGGSGKSIFDEYEQGWKVECEHRHRGCPVNMRTHYCLREENAWEMWDTRI